MGSHGNSEWFVTILQSRCEKKTENVTNELKTVPGNRPQHFDIQSVLLDEQTFQPKMTTLWEVEICRTTIAGQLDFEANYKVL
jgi:hypothetical protein